MPDVVALTYDTLPSLSNLRRETDEHGNLRISMSTGSRGVLARRAVMFKTAWMAGLFSLLAVVFLVAILLPMVSHSLRRLPPSLLPLLIIAAGVFYSALFLLLWTLEYRQRMDDLQRAGREAYVVSVTREGLFIESNGPLGAESATIRGDFDLRLCRAPGSSARCLKLITPVRPAMHLFVGLSDDELRWIASELKRRKA